MLFCVSSTTMSFFWLFLFSDPVFFWLYVSFDCVFFKECVFLQWLHLFSMTTSIFKDAYFFSFFSGYVFLLIVSFFKDWFFCLSLSKPLAYCVFLLPVTFFWLCLSLDCVFFSHYVFLLTVSFSKTVALSFFWVCLSSKTVPLTNCVCHLTVSFWMYLFYDIFI